MAAVIALDDVALAFPGGNGPIFAGIDLVVGEGEFVTLVGASGAGKSSLLRIVAGLVPPSAGRVERRLPAATDRRGIAMVFQEARLLPWRRVAANVALGLEGLVASRAARERRVADALALVRLADLAERWPHELSGGQRQRVGIARALAVAPDVLLMDEPFGALDAITRARLQDELVRIRQETGTSVLFVTHDIDEAAYLGDRVVLLGGSPARILQTYPVEVGPGHRRDAPATRAAADRVRADLAASFAEGGET
ncbi:MAG: ABC transporter ATP-binding protein [Pseudomonadota bacterium]